MNPEEIVPEWAFAGVPRLRHVSVESGIRLIGAEAWQDCRQLRIVKLPATVVGIADNAFRDCKLLWARLGSKRTDSFNTQHPHGKCRPTYQ